jgi:hypothetical protein
LFDGKTIDPQGYLSPCLDGYSSFISRKENGLALCIVAEECACLFTVLMTCAVGGCACLFPCRVSYAGGVVAYMLLETELPLSHIVLAFVVELHSFGKVGSGMRLTPRVGLKGADLLRVGVIEKSMCLRMGPCGIFRGHSLVKGAVFGPSGTGTFVPAVVVGDC